MNCENLREILAEDPARHNEEFDRHAVSCAACRAYRKRLLRAEELIQRALRFDVNATRDTSAGAGYVPLKRTNWVTLTSGIAAGLLAAVTFWALLGGDPELTYEELAAEVAGHWYNEPESWVESDLPVSRAVLTNVLDGTAEINLAELTNVSYAETCLVAGELIPHLVIQGEQGPYMVLLMPGRMLESPVPLRLPDEGLSGHILPAGPGSIAVLGSGQVTELEQVEASVVSAVNWTI